MKKSLLCERIKEIPSLKKLASDNIFHVSHSAYFIKASVEITYITVLPLACNH